MGMAQAGKRSSVGESAPSSPSHAHAPSEALLRQEVLGDDVLLCEGYLKKIRGIGQNRKRWFRLTETQIAYFTRESGSPISSLNRRDISSVEDQSPTRILILSRAPWGQSQSKEMLLEAADEEAKNKWLLCLRQPKADVGFRADDGLLLCEGYLNKLQPFGVMNRMRWFTFTTRHFAYYTKEAGVIMASCGLDNIVSVSPKGTTAFRLVAAAPFTKTGASAVTCECESPEALNKWLTAIRLVLKDKIKVRETTETEREADIQRRRRRKCLFLLGRADLKDERNSSSHGSPSCLADFRVFSTPAVNTNRRNR